MQLANILVSSFTRALTACRLLFIVFFSPYNNNNNNNDNDNDNDNDDDDDNGNIRRLKKINKSLSGLLEYRRIMPLENIGG